MVGDAATTLASNLGDAASNLGVAGGSRFDEFPSWIDACVHGCIDYIYLRTETWNAWQFSKISI